jgi:hypothetical protein
MPGAGRNPWPACRKESRRQSPQVQPNNPAFPARWFSGLYVLSPGTGSLAPVACALVAIQTSPQHREARTTRFHRPRCVVRPCTKRTLRHLASTASHPACRDDRDTPLVPRRDVCKETQFPKKRKKNFWTEGRLSGDLVGPTAKMNFSAQRLPAAGRSTGATRLTREAALICPTTRSLQSVDGPPRIIAWSADSALTRRSAH